MKAAFGSWAFAFGPYADHPVPILDVARELARVGYDGIEVSGFPPHVSLDDYATSASRRELARRFGDLGLAVSCYTADFSLVNPSIESNHRAYLDLFARYAELAREIGSPSVRVDTGTAPSVVQEDEHDDTMSRIAGVWQRASEIARAEGVKVVWEFEPGYAFNKPSDVVALHAKVAHPSFSILFDTAHAHMCSVMAARQQGRPEHLAGGVAQFLELCEGRIGHLHLVDSDGTLLAEETSTHRPFGRGAIPFFKLAQRLRATAAEWWCVDLCFCENSWDEIAPSLDYLRSLQRAGL